MYSLKLLPLSPDICYCLLNRIKQILCSHNIFEVLFLLQQVSVSAEGNIRSKCIWTHPFKVHLDEALVERIREATNGNYALGNQRFQAEIERALGRRATRGKAGRRPKAQAKHHSK